MCSTQSTNSLALDKKTIDWLCTIDDCEVYITIDGYKELHDNNRKTANGQPTFFYKILSKLHYFKETYVCTLLYKCISGILVLQYNR